MTHAGDTDPWERGEPYERYVGRWSRLVAPRFLDWLDVPPGRRWVDVGCGTGALSAAVLATRRPASLVGVEPSDGFRETARRRLPAAVDLRPGTAAAIPLRDGAADAVVSGLVLNFAPDPDAALREMRRVAAVGGRVAAYVWDYAEGMQLIRAYWDAAVEVDPAAAALDEAARFPLCRPAPLEDLFARAGLRDVRVTGIEVPTAFAGFDEYWLGFQGGQGPAPGHLASLTPEARARLEARLRARLPLRPDGSLHLVARAWAVRGSAA